MSYNEHPTIVSHIFKAYDVRGKTDGELTADVCYAVGRAMADWLPREGTVAVGHDMRPDSQAFAKAMIDGLTKQGRDVWDIGEVTSDMIYFAIGKWDLAGGVVITASHNAGNYNGIKIYRDNVTPVGLDSGLSEIRDIAASGTYANISTAGNVTQKVITDEWVAHALSMVHAEKWPTYHIAIDAGNGMAGAILPTVLEKLPQLDAQRMYFELDGTFPNHEANPQKTETLHDLVGVVTKNSLDFGLAFDGDGDRAGFVDDKGRPVLGTDLISIVAHYMLTVHTGSKIVHDVRTSRATRELIKEWGGEPVRTKAGRVYIGDVVRKVGAWFGGETTGHLFFKDNFDADSGLIAALVVIEALSNSDKKLSELVDEYRRYVMPVETNYDVDDSKALFEKIKAEFSEVSVDELDGVTVELEDGWFNLRASNTEPLVRLNIEAKDEQALHNLQARLMPLIESS